MPRTHQIVWTTLALLIAASPPAAAQERKLLDLPNDVELNRYSMTRRWHVQVPMLRGRENILSLKIVDGLLFAASNTGLLHCIDAETGGLRWTATVGAGDGVVHPPALTDQYVYVTSRNHLIRLNRKTGRVIWTDELPSLATSGPAANEDFVYVQTADQRIYAISLKDDTQDTNLPWPNKRVYTKRPVKWFYSAGGPMVDPPILLEDRVAFATQAGVVYAASLDKGVLFYRYLTHSPLAAPLAHLDRSLFIATREYNLYAIDLVDGTTRWKHIVGYPVYAQPMPFKDQVFVLAQGAGLLCLGAKDGALHWSEKNTVRLAGVSKESVYALDVHNHMDILARQDGKHLATLKLPDFTVICDNQFSDRIYMSTKDGLVLCMHELVHANPFQHPQAEAREKQSAKTKLVGKEAKKGTGLFDDVLDDPSMKEPPPRPKKPVAKDDDDEDTPKVEKKPKAPRKPRTRKKSN